MSDDESRLAILNEDAILMPKASRANKTASSHPKYVDMVAEAVKQLDEKKGASVIAIKQWIINTYPEIDQSRLNYLLRMAIKRGIDTGLIVRPKKSEGLGALTGRYKLGKPPKAAPKKKTAAVRSKKRVKSPVAKKSRKHSDHDVFDYKDDVESGSGDDKGDSSPSTPPAPKKSGGRKMQKAAPRPRSASANITPKPRASKSKVVRRSKSQSPAPSRAKKLKKPAAKSKSPAKRSTSKSPARKPKSKTAAATKRSPATAASKPKKPAPKKKTPTKKTPTKKTPTKKTAKPAKKKATK